MRHLLRHPARLLPLSLLIVILIGTALLMLPAARAAPGGAPFLAAFFTATSAACVTGLVVKDTATYWTDFGRGIILALFQVGGFGIMTAATLLGTLVTRRLSLTRRLIAQTETKALSLGDVTAILRLVFIVTVTVELATTLILFLHLKASYGMDWKPALWTGFFHAVSAFNNAGFSTYSDSLVRFDRDPVVLLPLMTAVVVGGIGFPVLYELRQGWRQPGRLSVHSKITLAATACLLLVGALAVGVYEWSNMATLGSLAWPDKLLNAASYSVMTRTAGFNSVDIAHMRPQTLVVSYALMLIGGGSASTAGGLKVTTFCLLYFAVWAEIRGKADTTVFNRRIGSEFQRQALTVSVLAIAVVGMSVLSLLSVTTAGLRDVVFEVISAFATVGLSTGITPHLPASGQVILIVLMFIGRAGTVTIASALALQPHGTPYRFPKERLIIG